LISQAPSALPADDRDEREVRVVSVQGDVRLSRGDGKRPDLKKPWEQAQSGQLIEQGFALATGNGRAEIEFEYGSTVFLAENSLLLFGDLSTRSHGQMDFDDASEEYPPLHYLFLFKKLAPRGDRLVSRMTLATGSATFALQPASNETFFIETPTDAMQVPSPDTFFGRVDAYLDAAAITPQGQKGERVVRPGLQKYPIARGQTLFFQGGEIIERPSSVQGAHALISASEALRDPVLSAFISEGSEGIQDSANNPPGLAPDWDSWVSARIQQKSAVMAAALKASGLPSPIPGLADMYQHGSFFPCEPYGTCWEPGEGEPSQDSVSQSSIPNAQSPAPSQANTVFQPQTVEWEEVWSGWCGTGGSRRISRVAHTPEELQKLLRKKGSAEKANYRGNFYSTDCYEGNWIPHRRHFARVITQLIPPKCVGTKCKPVHAPRPVWVRAGNKVGFVPRHPNDVKGKPPLNLKNGIILPASKPGQPAQHAELDSSQKIKILDKAPREFQRESSPRVLAVSAPEIHAHLIQELARNTSASVANHHEAPKIAYDYKSQKFMMASSAVSGAKSREVPVGGITSHGSVASFADGHSSRYAESFGHSTAAASYGGGFRTSGSYAAGGGHYSGSYSSGSYSGGSHSSGSSSSGGSYSHASSGGGGSSSAVSSSSAGSSSPASSGSGGHGKP
jgi:hypothetical protein